MPKTRAPFAWVGFVFLAVVVWLISFDSLTRGGIDFSVYWRGGHTLVHGWGSVTDLYPFQGGLPFTSPPFAAMIFMIFGIFPEKIGALLMVLLILGMAWWVSKLVYDYAHQRGKTFPLEKYLGHNGTIATIMGVIVASGPWWSTLGLTQINALIMLLVLADLLRPATRVPRGVLIGVAGGIKLTPLAFGLILLMRKDIKGVITLGISFAATIALGFILIPTEARQFWFDALSDPARVGNLNYPDNISIKGNILHTGLPEHSPLASLLVYGLILILLVGVAIAIAVMNRSDMLMSQISLNALLMIAMSPISWSHHNTWLPLFLVALWVDGFGTHFVGRGRGFRITVAVLAWIATLGLYISPMRIAKMLNFGRASLDFLSPLPLIGSAIPATLMYLVAFIWVAVIIVDRHIWLPVAAKTRVASVKADRIP